MAFRPGFAPQFGFHQAQPIYFNPMLGRTFNPHVQQHQQQRTPPVRPTPVTTVFVGNISDKCTNEFMQQMLQECGVVSSWKRIQGSNGKYQAFGFCDYDRPEGTLRSLRVLNEFQIGDKKLVVKAEDKVREDLRKWAIDQRREEGKPDLPLSKEELPADEDDMKKDEEVRLKILNWIETDHPQLLTLAEDGELSDKEAKDKKEKDSKNRDKDKDDSRAKVSDRRRGRSRSPARGRGDNDRHRGRSRSPKHKRTRRRSRSSSGSHSSSGSSSDSSDSSRSRSRSESPRKTKKRKERSPSRNRDSEDSEDARERKALKKMIREKEHNYTVRLKKWEKREKEQAKKYEKEERLEKDKKKNTMKEAKKLKNFLEDYDDEKDDPKYYKHSSLFQRKREFEREREADQKDRLREQQEIEELKRQIMEGDKDAEAAEKEARKQHQEQEEAALRKLRADSGSPNPHQPLGRREGDEDSSSSSDDGSDDEEGPKKKDDNASPGSPSGAANSNGNGDVLNGTSGHVTPATVATPVSAPGSGSTQQDKWKSISSPVVMALDKKDIKSPATVSGPSKRENSSTKLNGVFGEDDDDDATARKRMRPVHFTKEDRMETMTNEERKKLVAELVARIPTVKEEIFAFPIDWTFVDKPMIDQRIKPWVSKKICEFIGEEDNALIDFICEKVIAKVAPSTILDDIKQILDDDAEVFVVKMWRFLIYESEAKKGGLPSQSSSKSAK